MIPDRCGCGFMNPGPLHGNFCTRYPAFLEKVGEALRKTEIEALKSRVSHLESVASTLHNALIVDLVEAMPPDADQVWRILGYDPDGWPCFEGPMEPIRAEVEGLLERLRHSYTLAKLERIGEEAGVDGTMIGGSIDVRKLGPPPGPLCWGCDELIQDTTFWYGVNLLAKGVRTHDSGECKTEALQRLQEEGS